MAAPTPATGLLPAMLWHPWRTRLRLRRRIVALHRLQQHAIAVVTQQEHASLLYEQIDPDGRCWEAWGLTPPPD